LSNDRCLSRSRTDDDMRRIYNNVWYNTQLGVGATIMRRRPGLLHEEQ
jgi:hypothetical protein